MVRAYVGGKRVTKEELSKIEIQSEKIKRILAEKLAKEKRAVGVILSP